MQYIHCGLVFPSNLSLRENHQNEDLEDVENFLMRCNSMAEDREKWLWLTKDKVVVERIWRITRVTAVLRYACTSKGIGRRVESIWQKQFLTDA